MKTEYKNAGVEVRLTDSHYTEGALIRQKRTDLEPGLTAAADAMRDADRAFTDQSRPVSRAIARRDGAAFDLEETARGMQAALNGRSAHAKEESPAIDVFPEGLGQLTEAGVDDKGFEALVLAGRVARFLPEEDGVRLDKLPVLLRQIDVWDAAVDAITAANVELETSRQARARAIEAWEGTMISVYGKLLQDLGRKKAARFFRKSAKTRLKE